MPEGAPVQGREASRVLLGFTHVAEQLPRSRAKDNRLLAEPSVVVWVVFGRPFGAIHPLEDVVAIADNCRGPGSAEAQAAVAQGVVSRQSLEPPRDRRSLPRVGKRQPVTRDQVGYLVEV